MTNEVLRVAEHRGEKSCQTGRPITTPLSYCFGYPVKRFPFHTLRGNTCAKEVGK